jgi:flagella basal body P-ring formation protein FlgA
MRGKECNPTEQCPRRASRAGALVLCAWLGAAATARADVLRAWPNAVVVEDSIRVGDVCDLQGFDPDAYEQVRNLTVASAPRPGGSTVIRLDEIRATLARHGVNMASVIVKGASQCAVSRPQAAIPPPMAGGNRPGPGAGAADAAASGWTLRQAVEAFFQNEVERIGATARVQFGRTSQPVLDLSGPEFEFVVQRRSGRTLGMVELDVIVQREGKTIQTVPMVVNVSFSKPVVVARRSINAQATVEAEDVQVVEMSFTQFSQAGVSDPARVVGQQAKRFIPAGEMIQLRELEPVPLVHRGQIVDVHTHVGGVSVVTACKAMQSGAYGGSVELRSGQGRGARLCGMVVGPGRVEVRPSREDRDEERTLLAVGAAQ